MQMGYNPQNNNLPQVKVMVGSVDVGVNGHLIATEVVSGQKADDPLYVPVIERLRHTLKESGLLYMGDSKMGGHPIWQAHGDFYLVPLAKVGEIKQLLFDCVENIVSDEQMATLIFDNQSLLAAGYETTRPQSYTSPEGQEHTWEERLLVVRSLSDANKWPYLKNGWQKRRKR